MDQFAFDDWLMLTILSRRLIDDDQKNKIYELQAHYQRQGQRIPLRILLIRYAYLSSKKFNELQQEFHQAPTN